MPELAAPLGQFMEISVQTADIAQSVEFYEELGLRHAVVGDTWSHRYAVLSDGHLFLGLHEYDFSSPALTYVRPELEQHLGYLDGLGIRFAFRKTGEEVFNEAGFCDPDGQMVALLEARTFSPPTFESESFTVCGTFDEFSLPVRSLQIAIDFWEPLGFVLTDRLDTPPASATLTSDGINLGLYEGRPFNRPAVTFREPDMSERVDYLRGQGFELEEQSPGISVDGSAHTVLLGPEGLQLFLASE